MLAECFLEDVCLEDEDFEKLTQQRMNTMSEEEIELMLLEPVYDEDDYP